MAASEHIQTDLDRDPEWWANWFEQDFSWEGLKKKLWRGWVVVDERHCMPKDDAPEGAAVRKATLQDYWRADPEADWSLRDLGEPGEAASLAELVQLGDTVWHRAHLPPTTFEGVCSWKADPNDKRFEAHWAQVQADLQTRLAQGFESKFDWLGEPKGADGRAQLNGVIINALSLPNENEGSPVHLSMAYTAHLLGINAANTHFGGAAWFYSASFGGDADFESASFGENAGFESASFGDNARFDSASFGDNARFDSASFGRYAGFYFARFGGTAWFYSASFGEYSRFHKASFGENAWFNKASFGGYTWFHKASFGGYTSFYSASFGEYASFKSAVFFKSADFQRGSAPAQAAGRLVAGAGDEAAIKAVTKAAEESDYTLVLTHGAAKRETGAFKDFDFSEVWCLGDVDFSDRGFGTAPDFQNSRFYGRADFHKADMHEGVKLTGAQYRLDDNLGVLSWPTLVAHLSLIYAPFGPYRYGPVKLGTKDHIAFWKAAQRAWNVYHDGTCTQEIPVRGVLKTAFGFPTQLTQALRKPNQTAKPHSSHRHLDAPAEYEASYRRLKRIMGGIGSHIEEQRFFALELIARQQRTDVNIWERRVAADYGLIADYGRSFVRPLMALAVVCVVMSGLYTGLAGLGGALPAPGFETPPSTPITEVRRPNAPPYTRASVWQKSANAIRWAHLQFVYHEARRGAVLNQLSGPIAFAAEITMAPVANPVRHHRWAMALNDRSGAWAAAFSLLRLIHRILAIPLIFLFALSLRRRFQLG